MPSMRRDEEEAFEEVSVFMYVEMWILELLVTPSSGAASLFLSTALIPR